jgi:putative transposase
MEDQGMPQKKHKREENEPLCAMGSSAMANAKLRQVDVLVSQGRSVAEAVRSIGVTQFTYFRWRKEFGGQRPGWWCRRPRAEPPA